MAITSRNLAACAIALVLALWAPLVPAEFHLFRIDQLYTNADGSVQYIVLRESSGANGENRWGGQTLRATNSQGGTQQIVFPSNLPSASTAGRSVLVATSGFAALGIVAPDYTIPAGFLPVAGGTVNFAGVDQWTFDPLPTDGSNALFRSGAMAQNAPRNFAGATGTITPSPAVATAIEYYHAALDHYFITHLPAEIAILDAGVTIRGWLRTGQMIPVYAGSGAGTSPVCRFRIPPDKGDSHFYGRGTAECDATALNNPTFFNEDAQFFHVVLPVAGVCSAGLVVIYRVFSNRLDANHRYMIDRAIRDEMVNVRHWQPEGDGDDYVVMCGPGQAAAAPPPPTPAPTPPMPTPPDPGDPYYPYP